MITISTGLPGGGGALRFVFAFLVLAACAPVGGPLDNVQKDYVEQTLSLGIIPVYPPREEFQVGDIYLVSQGDTPDSAVSVWYSRYDAAREAAADFLNTRIAFRRTANRTKPDAPKPAINPQDDVFGNLLSTRGDVLIETLPIAAFPQISSNAGRNFSLGINRALSALGFANATQTTVTLDFVDVRTYWVPVAELPAGFSANAFGYDGSPFHKSLIRGQLEERLVVKSPELAGLDPHQLQAYMARCRKTHVRLVTRVYLTREIQYTYSNAQITAAAIRQARGDPADVNLGGVVVPNIVNVQVAGAPDNGAIAPEALNTAVAEIAKVVESTTEGDGIAFESWDARGITFSRTYERPVAIGYGGVKLPVSYEQIFLGANGKSTNDLITSAAGASLCET